MDYTSSKFSIEFRDLVVKAVKDDLFQQNNTSHFDVSNLISKYNAILNNLNGFIVISNYVKGVYEYISEGVYSNLGYDLRNCSNEELTEFMISIITAEHREFMFSSLFPLVLEYFKQHATPTTGTDYRYTCCVQIRNAFDKPVWHLIDTIVIEADPNGFPIRTLITCTNVDLVKKDDCVDYNISKKNRDGIYQVVLEGTADNRIVELKLTAREVEIINLISRGNTNQEIADKLHISLHTVQTHRKNIMRKTDCSGTAELTNFAFSRGLL
jgi:DNA-binding CsgD family transcriptional regulator